MDSLARMRRGFKEESNGVCLLRALNACAICGLGGLVSVFKAFLVSFVLSRPFLPLATACLCSCPSTSCALRPIPIHRRRPWDNLSTFPSILIFFNSNSRSPATGPQHPTHCAYATCNWNDRLTISAPYQFRNTNFNSSRFL